MEPENWMMLNTPEELDSFRRQHYLHVYTTALELTNSPTEAHALTEQVFANTSRRFANKAIPANCDMYLAAQVNLLFAQRSYRPAAAVGGRVANRVRSAAYSTGVSSAQSPVIGSIPVNVSPDRVQPAFSPAANSYWNGLDAASGAYSQPTPAFTESLFTEAVAGSSPAMWAPTATSASPASAAKTAYGAYETGIPAAQSASFGTASSAATPAYSAVAMPEMPPYSSVPFQTAQPGYPDVAMPTSASTAQPIDWGTAAVTACGIPTQTVSVQAAPSAFEQAQTNPFPAVPVQASPVPSTYTTFVPTVTYAMPAQAAQAAFEQAQTNPIPPTTVQANPVPSTYTTFVPPATYAVPTQAAPSAFEQAQTNPFPAAPVQASSVQPTYTTFVPPATYAAPAQAALSAFEQAQTNPFPAAPVQASSVQPTYTTFVPPAMSSPDLPDREPQAQFTDTTPMGYEATAVRAATTGSEPEGVSVSATGQQASEATDYPVRELVFNTDQTEFWVPGSNPVGQPIAPPDEPPPAPTWKDTEEADKPSMFLSILNGVLALGSIAAAVYLLYGFNILPKLF